MKQTAEKMLYPALATFSLTGLGALMYYFLSKQVCDIKSLFPTIFYV